MLLEKSGPLGISVTIPVTDLIKNVHVSPNSPNWNDFFIESYRVDNPVLSPKFNVYVNLMLTYIILESDSELFEPFNVSGPNP